MLTVLAALAVPSVCHAELVFTPSLEVGGETATRNAVGLATLGVDVAAGPVNVFVEPRYHMTTPRSHPEGGESASAGALVNGAAFAGFRLTSSSTTRTDTSTREISRERVNAYEEEVTSEIQTVEDIPTKNTLYVELGGASFPYGQGAALGRVAYPMVGLRFRSFYAVNLDGERWRRNVVYTVHLVGPGLSRGQDPFAQDTLPVGVAASADLAIGPRINVCARMAYLPGYSKVWGTLGLNFPLGR
ncbi:MAG: hypothetical protein H6739_39940 [Alphaproteobacteria bacterium]|nr:hypothetical protein [Alphaproteobacteria bacterium]